MKLTKILSIILVAVFACTALASCNLVQKNVTPGALTYIGLRINPEIEMVADANGTIVSANAVNADGEVILATTGLEGLTIEDAAVEFTETAVDLGYMDPAKDKDTVYVDVNGENTEVAEKVEKSVNNKLMKFFEKKGITAKVSKEVLDTYLAAAEEWNVAPGHAKIIARVLSANPELTYDQLLNLTVKELLELLKADKHEDKISADLKDEYKDKIDALKEEYKELFELRDDIEDIEEDLEEDEDELTAEEKAALEKELEEKKAAAKALEEEFKTKVAALKEEYKEFSQDARENFRKEAEERKQAKKDGRDFDDDDDDDDDEDDDDDRREHGKNDTEKKDGKKEEPKHDADKDDDDDDDDDDDKDDDEDDKKHHENRGDKKPADAPAAPEAPEAPAAPEATDAPAENVAA